MELLLIKKKMTKQMNPHRKRFHFRILESEVSEIHQINQTKREKKREADPSSRRRKRGRRKPLMTSPRSFTRISVGPHPCLILLPPSPFGFSALLQKLLFLLPHIPFPSIFIAIPTFFPLFFLLIHL